MSEISGHGEAHAMKEFIEQKGVHPTFIGMMKSKRKETVGVRIYVITADLKATLETDFSLKMSRHQNDSLKSDPSEEQNS